MGPSIPWWVERIYRELGAKYKGREFAAMYDYDANGWKFVERDDPENNSIYLYNRDVEEEGGYETALKEAIKYFKPKDKTRV